MIYSAGKSLERDATEKQFICAGLPLRSQGLLGLCRHLGVVVGYYSNNKAMRPLLSLKTIYKIGRIEKTTLTFYAFMDPFQYGLPPVTECGLSYGPDFCVSTVAAVERRSVLP